MQRKIWSILAFLFLSVNLYGCNNQENLQEQNQQTIEDESVPQAHTITEQTSQESDAENHTEENLCYAFQKLTEEEKLVYDEIFDLLGNQTSEGKISTRSADTLKKVFQCVMDDHPELFYVSGYQYTAYSLAGNVTRIMIQPSYEMTADEIAASQKKINAYVSKCFSNLDEKESDYSKVRYLYEYVILNTEYINGVENSQNICSVFINHESVCQGYAKALQYLCQKAGLQTALVNGTLHGVGHAWNLVKLDGAWYYVDATLGDASYVSDNEEQQMDHVPPISYDYLCVTTDMILETHVIDNEVPVPECKATDCNYYVQENLFFDQYDENHAKELFTKAWQNGEHYLTIQCADSEVFEDVKKQLIDEQKVFSFIGNKETAIGYAQNKVLRTLSFWVL